MKKILSLIFIFMSCTVYAQINPENISKAAPTNPEYIENNYNVLKSYEYVAVKMKNTQFCKDVTIVRNKDQSKTMKFNNDKFFKAGPFMFTTDRVLEAYGFYTYSDEMLKEYKIESDNRKEKNKLYNGTEEKMRGATVNYKYYYQTAYSIYNGYSLPNVFKGYEIDNNIKFQKNLYGIKDPKSSTGFKEINYELIEYYTSKPILSKPISPVYYDRHGKFAGVGDDAFVEILGCYAVQQSYGHDIDYNKDYEFYWLVLYKFKGNNYNVQLTNKPAFKQQQNIIYTKDNSTLIPFKWINIIEDNS